MLARARAGPWKAPLPFPPDREVELVEVDQEVVVVVGGVLVDQDSSLLLEELVVEEVVEVGPVVSGPLVILIPLLGSLLSFSVTSTPSWYTWPPEKTWTPVLTLAKF